MATAKAVLETYELLELIIQQLPTRDITRVRRVSKAWKTFVSSERIHELRVPSVRTYGTPPVQAISPWFCPDQFLRRATETVNCTIYNKEGVRVRDVVTTYWRLGEDAREEVQDVDEEGHYVHVCVQSYKYALSVKWTVGDC